MLIDIETLKPELGITSNEHDTLLTEWIARASAVIADWCEQPIEQTEIQYEFYGNGYSEIVHGYHPVTVSTIKLSSGIGGTWDTVSAAYDAIEPDGVPIIRLARGFTRDAVYRATLSVGYAADAIPPMVRGAAVRMIRQEWLDSEHGQKRFGIEQQAKNDGEHGALTTKFIDNTPGIRKDLLPYRRRRR